MPPTVWGTDIDDSTRRDQLRLVYDYIKFHIGLYLSTPAALALVADGLGVKQTVPFIIGIATALLVYLPAGIHAGLFMARHINDPWQQDYLQKFEREAFRATRGTMHHTLYWIGLGAGLLGLSAALLQKFGLLSWP